MKLTVASTVGQNSTLQVSDMVFGAPVNNGIIAQAVRVYLSNQRQGTSKVKTRSEVNRTKKKWFKQKGTGNARHGARTPSLFVGGGVAHGPTGLQNYILKMPSTMKKSALISVLSAQVKNIVICDDLAQLDGKSASADKLIKKMLPEAEHVLVVLSKGTDLVMRSLRNLDYVYVTTADLLTTYEVAYADAIVMTKDAVKMIEDRLVKAEGKVAKVAPVAEVQAAPKAKVVSKAKVVKEVKEVKKAAPKKKVAAKK
jgi:large subunit ribosomal protein L4